uniref:Uncharacterized protein n=1 Tax=Rhizophora mucronata TaxID=61149 RepID=A0A2P2N5G7_RHIMU
MSTCSYEREKPRLVAVCICNYCRRARNLSD